RLLPNEASVPPEVVNVPRAELPKALTSERLMRPLAPETRMPLVPLFAATSFCRFMWAERVVEIAANPLVILPDARLLEILTTVLSKDPKPNLLYSDWT